MLRNCLHNARRDGPDMGVAAHRYAEPRNAVVQVIGSAVDSTEPDGVLPAAKLAEEGKP